MPSSGGRSIQAAVTSNFHTLEHLNCLIVDNNNHMRALLKGVLRAFGIRRIHEAADGAGAIEELKMIPMDLIITEFALDTLDGIELTKLIRLGSDSSNPLIPVIMLTGHTERHVVAQARDVGVNEFLAKPISAEALYVRIVSTVFSPRPFVRTKGFLGPDRRRHEIKRLPGSDHRVNKPEFIMPRVWVAEATDHKEGDWL